MGTHHHTTRSSAVGIMLAITALSAAACGSDTADNADTAAAAGTEGSPTTSAASADSVDDSPAASTETTVASADATAASEPPPTTAPAPTVPPEPVPVRERLTLTAGWTYATQNFGAPFTFAAPDDDVLGRWRLLFDTSNYVVLTLQPTDQAEPSVRREEPGVSFYVLPDGVDEATYVDAFTAYAAEQDEFSADVSTGEFLGTAATVISGSYDMGEPGGGALFIRLSDAMSRPTAPGEREYLSYVAPFGDETVVVTLNAHELDADMNITLVNQILDSLEFS